jgi:16S rRNA (guanine527-N7)-methyltransferase
VLTRFVDQLLAENNKLNLTAIRTPAGVWAVHICDALALRPHLRAAGVRTLIDLGTGGGVPGLPLACVCPEIEFVLIDSTGKKVAAVGRMIAALGLTNARAVAGRGEVLSRLPEFRERFDALTARAVAKLPQLIAFAAGFVRPGGAYWFYKTSAATVTETAAAASAARRAGLEFRGPHTYRLPGEHGERALIEYRQG